MTDAFPPGSMTWLLGIEDTCVYPPARFDMAPLDEYELTGHTDQWREGLAPGPGLRAPALPDGVNWPPLPPAPRGFDWAGLHERAPYAAGRVRLTRLPRPRHHG